MFNFTEQQFINETVRVLSSNPNRIYENPCGGQSCFYLEVNGEPGCIFGQVILNLDPTQTELLDSYDRSLEAHPNYTGEGDILVVVSNILRKHTIFTSKTIEWAARIQYAQDHGTSWGDCLKQNPVPELNHA